MSGSHASRLDSTSTSSSASLSHQLEVSRDEDAGLRFDEFEELLGWCVGATVSKDKRERMFNDLLKAGGDDDHDGEIDNGTIFSICVMRAKDCVLARPRETRCFWQLPWDIEM